MKNTEEFMKFLAPNYVGGGLFVNPNPGTGVKAAETLNKISADLRTTDFFKKYVKEEGFQLCPIDFKFEWIIKFNNKLGYMAIRETGFNLELFVYSSEEDMNWNRFIINNFTPNKNSIKKLGELIKVQYRVKIQ